MEITGQRHIAAPLSKVAASLASDRVLQSCLPEWIVHRMGPDALSLSPRDNPGLRAAVSHADAGDPHHVALAYRIDGTGGAGAEGRAAIALTEEGDFTLLHYHWPDAVVGAELAIERFLGRFAAEVASPREIMADGGVGMAASVVEANRPQAHPSAFATALAAIPLEVLGLPIVFWMGSGLFAVIFLLIASAYI